MKMSKPEFTGRHGDPSSFTFKGQYYDAGPQSKMKCSLCGQDMQLVYVLRNDRDRSVPISFCCFEYFRNWNPILHTQLLAAQLLLQVVIRGEAQDVKVYGPRMQVRERMDKWRKMKRQALDIIRDYHKKTGKDWLPEELFELKLTAEKRPAQFKRPTNALKWYDQQNQVLETKIKEVQSVS